MYQRISLLTIAAGLAILPLAAVAQPVLGNDGVSRFPLNGRTMSVVYCRPLTVCDIALESGETITSIATGDSSRWQISTTASGASALTPHILIKPSVLNISTNVIVTTNERTYYLVLRSREVPPMIRVSFLYPQNSVNASASPTPAPTPTPVLDGDYESSGTRALFPRSVYSDGVHTYLVLDPKLQQLPAVFVVGPDGDQLVNYRIKGREYIIDGVPGRIALMLGTGRGALRAEIRHK